MAKQIIILETPPVDGGQIGITFVAWFPVAAARRIPLAGTTTSKWSGASASENQSLVDGSVKEEVTTQVYPASYTTTELKAALQKWYTDRLNYLNNQPNRIQYKDVFLDSVTGWSA